MTHVHFLKTFINYKSLKGNVTQSKKLHVQDEKSNNEIDEDRNNDNDVIDEGLKNEAIHEFLFPGSVCAIAVNKKSTDTMWLLKIVREGIADTNMYDESGHCIIQGSLFIEVKYLEYQDTRRHVKVYKKMGRKIHCYWSSMIHPLLIAFHNK